MALSFQGPLLDEDPPAQSDGGDLTMAQFTNDPKTYVQGTTGPSNGTVHLWTGKSMPTRSHCMDLLLTQGQQYVPISVRTVFCAESHNGRFAVATILSIDTSDPINPSAVAQVSVWSQPISLSGSGN
ncbi:hypothetical protein [Streptacidiphilus sp. P02-A3a]|uniref:hypothetical protein n=1 Tax=Streptacidiphilus sp. P02-A3a TaxID=2704468 RepID=UPI0015FBE26B|nr:hypothetical protein [Streptacidiphilus sp. P02-A3a]QMU71774.1 hypothetical protein GXP74_29580 [Streptacidiphilus sp. P02-A3a]